MKYIILGAGPAGLSFANRLQDLGESSYCILEKEKQVGGLCRSDIVDYAPIDIGGGHFLDASREVVTEYLFRFLPKNEWNYYTRDSRILFNGNLIGHPFESNIWQLPIENQVEYLKSIASAGCNVGTIEPSRFVDWIEWKLGKRIADDYMIPYNRKMFSNDLDSLGTYWLEKLPDVSFDDTLRSCLEHKAYGSEPGHSHFYYPKKYGYGEVWKRMGERIAGHLFTDVHVQQMDLIKHAVRDDNGEWYHGTIIVNTIPWDSFETIIGMSDITVESILKLKHNSIEVKYVENVPKSKAHWIYYPDINISYHRLLIRENFLPGSKGGWTETNIERIEQDDKCSYRHVNEYAYPLNTRDKPDVINRIMNESETQSVYALGRWGEHQHYNSDVVVDRALALADRLYWTFR